MSGLGRFNGFGGGPDELPRGQTPPPPGPRHADTEGDVRMADASKGKRRRRDGKPRDPDDLESDWWEANASSDVSLDEDPQDISSTERPMYAAPGQNYDEAKPPDTLLWDVRVAFPKTCVSSSTSLVATCSRADTGHRETSAVHCSGLLIVSPKR